MIEAIGLSADAVVAITIIVYTAAMGGALYWFSNEASYWRSRAMKSENDYRKLQDAIANYHERMDAKRQEQPQRTSKASAGFSDSELNKIKQFDPRYGQSDDRDHFPVV